jgi:N-acetylglucosaminyldiphosphoundecaprenol N-acetyl-beta-D-mannosaminyltransferase
MNHQLIPDCMPILGIEVSRFPSYDAAVELIRQRLLQDLPTFCVALNPEKLYRAKRDPGLKAILQKAHVRLCDGIGLSLASLLLNGKPIVRCTGVDLFLRLIQMSAAEGFRVFVLGASSHVNEVSCRMLRTTYPGLRLAGQRDGFFGSDDEIVRKINESRADLLFVAMGSPRQEDWIARNMSQLRPRLLMGVGGSLDVVSGTVRRAPAPFRKAGLEWLYRLLSQPSRFRRQLALPCFGWDVLREVSASRTRHAFK